MINLHDMVSPKVEDDRLEDALALARSSLWPFTNEVVGDAQVLRMMMDGKSYGKPWENMENPGKIWKKHGTTWKHMGKYGKIWDMTGIINGINLGNLDVPWDFTMVFYMPIWPSKRGSVSR